MSGNKKRKLIIAGNHRQYEYWCNKLEINPRQAIYLHREDQLLGFRNEDVEIILVGTWSDNPIIHSDRLQMFDSELRSSLTIDYKNRKDYQERYGKD